MKKIVWIFLALVTIVSCKKEQIIENDNIANSFLVTEEGAYWIYEIVDIDVHGNETVSQARDTVTVVGDTIINGKTFTKYSGTFMGGQPFIKYRRDSLGYIVNLSGSILYSFVHFGDTIFTSNDTSYEYFSHLKDESNTLFTVPAGSFETSVNQLDMYKLDQTPVDTCGNIKYSMKYRYAPNVGLVFQNCAYYFQMEVCGDRERRLVEYYIP